MSPNAMITIQRAIHKTLIIISIFLTHEFKHDETNRAWWMVVVQGSGILAGHTGIRRQGYRAFIMVFGFAAGSSFAVYAVAAIAYSGLALSLQTDSRITVFDEAEQPAASYRKVTLHFASFMDQRIQLIKYGIIYLVLTFFILMTALREYILTHLHSLTALAV
ncbi:hypothetical protein C8J56DRAFT_1163903 [Mycena floridula]|nr:hypothetical protein C8J56DRAFT_1163903 [Mycena floridula]